MKFIKTYEGFKVKNITEDDIIQCIRSNGFVFATSIKGFPNNDPESPLKPVSVDEDGLVTVEFEGKEYEIELKNIDKCDIPGVNEELTTDVLKRASEKWAKIGHGEKAKRASDWIHNRNFNKYGDFNCHFLYHDRSKSDIKGVTRDISVVFTKPFRIHTFEYYFDDESGVITLVFVFRCDDAGASGFREAKLHLEVELTDENYGEFSDEEPVKMFFNHGGYSIMFSDKKSAVKFKQVLKDLPKFVIESDEGDTPFGEVFKRDMMGRFRDYENFDVEDVTTILNKFASMNTNSLYLEKSKSVSDGRGSYPYAIQDELNLLNNPKKLRL